MAVVLLLVSRSRLAPFAPPLFCNPRPYRVGINMGAVANGGGVFRFLARREAEGEGGLMAMGRYEARLGNGDLRSSVREPLLLASLSQQALRQTKKRQSFTKTTNSAHVITEIPIHRPS